MKSCDGENDSQDLHCECVGHSLAGREREFMVCRKGQESLMIRSAKGRACDGMFTSELGNMGCRLGTHDCSFSSLYPLSSIDR